MTKSGCKELKDYRILHRLFTIVRYNGAFFEATLRDIIENAFSDGIPFVNAFTAISVNHLHSSEIYQLRNFCEILDILDREEVDSAYDEFFNGNGNGPF